MKIAFKYMISASFFLCVSYLTTFRYLLFGNNDSSLPNKRNEAAWTAAWSIGYHRLGNLESNYNRIPKYPSPSYTGSLSRVPVSRLVSQTRIGRTTKIGRREESGTGWPARWWLGSRQGWPLDRDGLRRGGETFFASNIYTFLLGAKSIRDHHIALAILSQGVGYSLVKGLACLAPSLFAVRCFLSW